MLAIIILKGYIGFIHFHDELRVILIHIIRTRIKLNGWMGARGMKFVTGAKALYQRYEGSLPAVLRLYTSGIKALCQRYEGSIPAVLRLYASGIKALYQRY